MPISISNPAILDLLRSVPKDAVTWGTDTALPNKLPLKFPTIIHEFNVICTMHLVYAIYRQPQYLAYVAETQPADSAVLRGVIGAYLASDVGWGPNNLLSAKAWAAGEMSEAKVAELFEIQIMREREHETMVGVRVGERYPPAVALASEIAETLKTLGTTIQEEYSCLGMQVVNALTQALASTTALPMEAKVRAFATHFCDNAVTLVPVMKDSYETPPNAYPASLVLLLQDLSNRFSSDRKLPIPLEEELADLSPLPLPIEVLLHCKILQLEGDADGVEDLRKATQDLWKGEVNDWSTRTMAMGNAPRVGSKVTPVPRWLLDELSKASVQACREIVAVAQSHTGLWPNRLTGRDVWRLFHNLKTPLDMSGRGLNLVCRS